VRCIDWADGAVRLIDQTALPAEERWVVITDPDELVDAIRRLAVRGAPALGAAGALGVALAARRAAGDSRAGNGARETAAGGAGRYEREIRDAAARLRGARPTAVNLGRGVDRALGRLGDGPDAVLAEARAILDEEAKACRTIGERGADLLQADRPLRLLTHCNTGWLATVEWGTALGVVTVLHERGLVERVYADETRPLLQGARLTAFELAALGVDHRVVVDGAAPSLIARRLVDGVVVGADRIAANGDVANKVGTYPLALAAARAGVPFVVAAPESTVDVGTPAGDAIEIEERDPVEVGPGPAYNPAFDVTPHDLVTAVVTERRTVRLSEGDTL
jgi:methylthioribose-1-phosphate isomerase